MLHSTAMECSAAGVLDATGSSASAVADLLERLACISGEAPRPLRQLEVVLTGPSYVKGQKGAELRLVHQLPPAGQQRMAAGAKAGCAPAAAAEQAGRTRWVVRHEGLPFRGKGMAEAPATVRAVAQSACAGADVPGFWAALGFARSYSLIKTGHCFGACWVEEQRLRVSVARVLRGGKGVEGGQEGEEEGEEVAPGFWHVEAVGVPAEGRHMEAAAAIGALAKMLAPLVVLQK